MSFEGCERPRRFPTAFAA